MLNLNCVICAELFSHTDDVYVTKCGHMFHYSCLCQWLERSKTCPQCRNKCTDASVHRVYFNLANLDTTKIDIGTLQEQLDNANLKIKVSEGELRKAEQQVKSLKQTQKKCMKTISGLEEKLQKNDFVILSYTEQMKMLKSQAKDADELRKEVKRLKEKVEMMENVSSILVSTTQDAEKMLKDESNPATLAVWVSALKRELRTCESKRTDIRNVLKVVQGDLRKESDLRKQRDRRVVQLESDNYNLTQKINKLEAEVEKNRLNTAVVIDSPSTSFSEHSRISTLHQDAKFLSISPSISERVKQIEESNSPYFNIKSSGIPFNMFSVGVKREETQIDVDKEDNDLSEKYSILKKPRLIMPAKVMKPSLESGVTYDGFGGSAIVSDPEEGKRPRLTTKKPSSQSLSSRLKAGKLRKFPSAGSETMDKFLNKS